MKTIFLFALVLYTINGHTQCHDPKLTSENVIQMAFFPGLVYNTAALGFGIKKAKVEHVFEANTYYLPFGAERFAIGVYYNRNAYWTNHKTFIPLWTGINRVNVNNNYEDGGPYYDELNFKIGSGIGHNIHLKRAHKIRLELGLGISLRFENQNSYDNESAFPFNPNLTAFTIAQDLPILPTTRIKIRYILPLK